MRILLALLIAVTATTAQADGIYKWVDENGVVHYGEQPPGDTQVHVIKKPKPERYKNWEKQNDIVAPSENPTAPLKFSRAKQDQEDILRQKTQAQINKAEAAMRSKLCKAHQKDLSTLTTNTRITAVDENGNHRRLSEEERQDRISKARKGVQENC
ncbi:DUF4124 domain-containing protein [Microbulbifer sp. JMSA003]|uniref:DUF4124 domain-containing protein n=1 Tax=Microbulbifer sp. JMSA003 TaxID=3243369 RepID=UPI004039C4ED